MMDNTKLNRIVLEWEKMWPHIGPTLVMLEDTGTNKSTQNDETTSSECANYVVVYFCSHNAGHIFEYLITFVGY